MSRTSKRREKILQMVSDEPCTIEEAVDLIAQLPPAGFRESVDIAVNLGVDPRKSEQIVRGTTTLPHGNGKETRIAVFTDVDVEAVLTAGANAVGMDDLAARMKQGELNYDVVIASPDSMRRVVSTLGALLGPRGLMPNPKMGTITEDVVQAVRDARAGQMSYRVDRNGIIHGSVGKTDFESAMIRENIEAVLSDLRKAKPASAKGVYIKKLTLSTTMGVGLPINLESLNY